jgi:hypothetical protein
VGKAVRLEGNPNAALTAIEIGTNWARGLMVNLGLEAWQAARLACRRAGVREAERRVLVRLPRRAGLVWWRGPLDRPTSRPASGRLQPEETP